MLPHRQNEVQQQPALSIQAAPFLTPSVKTALRRGGYNTVASVAAATPVQLLGACGSSTLTAEDAAFAVQRSKAFVESSSSPPKGEFSSAAVCVMSGYDMLLGTGGESTKMTNSEDNTEKNDRGGGTADGDDVAAPPSVAGGQIASFVLELDQLLGGGVPLGSLVEVCGAPGVGKTQFCMQLAVSAQLVPELGGVDGRVLYVDTEGSFLKQRFEQIAQAAIQNVEQVVAVLNSSVEGKDIAAAGRNTTTTATLLTPPTLDDLLSGVQYVRFHELLDIVAFSHALSSILETDRQECATASANGNPGHEKKKKAAIRVIIIDSLAFHFRYGLNDMAQRSRLLFGIGQQLQQTAKHFNVAILVTNQLTSSGGGGGPLNSGASSAGQALNHNSALVPALGDAWAHAVPTRVLLEATNTLLPTTAAPPGVVLNGNVSLPSHIAFGGPSSGEYMFRKATLVKSPFCARSACNFIVCGKGLRSVNELQSSGVSATGHSGGGQAVYAHDDALDVKRPRFENR